MPEPTRQEFLERRRGGIGASDAGVIAGVNPFKQPLQLYLEKIGELPDDDMPEDVAEAQGDPRYWGTVLEPIVADEYAKRRGVKVRRENQQLVHPKHPWMRCNLDRRVLGGDVKMAVEIKTARDGFGWGEDGSQDVPEYILLQAHHQMAVADLERNDVCVLIAGRDLRIYPIVRDDTIIDALIEREALFWDRVQARVPPEPDHGHRTTSDLLARLYRGTNGQAVALGEDALHWTRVYVDAGQAMTEYEKSKEFARNHIARLMGEAAVGTLPDGSTWNRKSVPRKEYTVSAGESIRMTLKEAKP